jgi:hypothetical protein
LSYCYLCLYIYIYIYIYSFVHFQLENQPNGVRFLHIVGVKLQHSGEIKCTTFASTDPDNLSVCYTELVVLPNSNNNNSSNSLLQTPHIVLNNNCKVDCTPYFVQTPEDCTTLVGQIVVLDAYFEGHPEPKVTWLRAVSIPRPTIHFKWYANKLISSRSLLAIEMHHI